MSANRIFLVCSHHASIDESLMLCERLTDEQYFLGKLKRADEWFTKHKDCGRGLDHFQIAYNRPQDWDVSMPAEGTVNGSVKLATALESDHDV